MSEPYSDYDGYLRANLKWFLSLGLLLAAIAAIAFLASGPAPIEHEPAAPPAQSLPQP